MCGYFHCTKNHISFFQMFWKDSLSKKIALIYDHWDMIFLVSPGKMIFVFPENMILLFRRKMKDDLSQKIHRNMIYFSNVLKRWSFHENRSRTWSFFYHRERWYFFFLKIWYFSTDGKWKMIFRKKTHQNMMFSASSVKMVFLFLQIGNYFSVKKAKMIFLRKIHLKMTFLALLIFIPEKMILIF